MAKKHHSRHGSMQFWPRKRAKRIYPRTRSWPDLDGAKLLGFAGYKAGMTQVSIRDNTNSITKGQIISVPATIIECPPLKPLSLRFYKHHSYGSVIIGEIFSKALDKELSRKITLGKKQKEEKIPENYDYLKLVVYTQPKLTTIGKKKPEVIELGISGELEFAKLLLNKSEIKIEDVFRENQYIDIHAVTKGKQHKSEKGTRRVGSLGNWYAKTWRVAHPGQTGFFKRTEHNKLIFRIENEKEINPNSGFHKYGVVKNDYVLIKGSVAGPQKRAIVLTEPIRDKKPLQASIISVKK